MRDDEQLASELLESGEWASTRARYGRNRDPALTLEGPTPCARVERQPETPFNEPSAAGEQLSFDLRHDVTGDKPRPSEGTSPGTDRLDTHRAEPRRARIEPG